MRLAGSVAVAAVVLVACVSPGPSQEEASRSGSPSARRTAGMSFVPAIRSDNTGRSDALLAFQMDDLVELGFTVVQGTADFAWGNIQRGWDVWKWDATDAQMDALAERGLEVVAHIMCPKQPGLPWDDSIGRDDPRFVEAFGELAYQVAHRYKDHAAWSGLVAVWGGSADVWDRAVPATDPEVVVPLLNAAHDGIKRADPGTIVIGFNFGTTAGSDAAEWEEYHERAFALAPRFDWYGVQTHGVFATVQEEGGGRYGGVQGLSHVRQFLDDRGYEEKPLWVNEAGFAFGEEMGGFSERVQAEQLAENFIMARTLSVDLRGWLLFLHFAVRHTVDDFGIMTSLDEQSPPAPREAWHAIRTLIREVGFFDFRFVEAIAGGVNGPEPFVLAFARESPDPGRLWVVFSPRLPGREPVSQEVAIDVSPATRVEATQLLGSRRTLAADADGTVTVTSTNSPLYLIASE